jgi:hypothetical protein
MESDLTFSPIRVPSLQIDLADVEDDVSDLSSPDQSDAVAPTTSASNRLISYLKPPPTAHTFPKRGLIILSPNTPNKR